MVRLLLVFALVAGCNDDGNKLKGCTKCACTCTTSMQTHEFTGNSICDCDSFCRRSSACGNNFVSARCAGQTIETDRCIAGAPGERGDELPPLDDDELPPLDDVELD